MQQLYVWCWCVRVCLYVTIVCVMMIDADVCEYVFFCGVLVILRIWWLKIAFCTWCLFSDVRTLIHKGAILKVKYFVVLNYDVQCTNSVAYSSTRDQVPSSCGNTYFYLKHFKTRAESITKETNCLLLKCMVVVVSIICVTFSKAIINLCLKLR